MTLLAAVLGLGTLLGAGGVLLLARVNWKSLRPVFNPRHRGIGFAVTSRVYLLPDAGWTGSHYTFSWLVFRFEYGEV